MYTLIIEYPSIPHTHNSATSPVNYKNSPRGHSVGLLRTIFNGDTKVRTLSLSSSDDSAPAERIPRSRPLHEQTSIATNNSPVVLMVSFDCPPDQPYL
ncbi:hypothetical protein PGTUg99_015282 [Puccinia graminis f. sp. tritici]|uniref:Uncharacterized protein n=1 Tax=Puccinia graminis f. sp. tritici TaxID=56615 RepID=A0A5B0RH32_PUCGR|nr:hypothetical protein PGTUg99_015282 [Puccinia graminis f. sp. tritici]